jgi:CelD/BcsL family acetyltransferase involved in cellulose biosynthesis
MLLPMMQRASPRPGIALFEKIEADGPACRAIRASGLVARAFRRPGVFRLDLDTPAEAILARASRKFRFNVRSRRRRVESLGRLDHRVVTAPASLESALDVFLALEAAGWKGTDPTGHAIALRPEVERHARALVGLAGGRGECEIHGLWQDERCVAALVGLAGPGELFVFKIARDESFSAFSVGHLLVESVVDDCRRRTGLAALNFGWEAEWMMPWGGRLTSVHDWYVALGGWRGRLAMLLLGAGEVMGDEA